MRKNSSFLPHQNGVMVIHQSRAHERILYEGYIRSWEYNEVLKQTLAVPLALTLDTPSIDLLKSHQEILGEMGFTWLSAEGDTIEFSSIPDVFDIEDIPSFLQQWLTQTTTGTVHAFLQRDIMARALAKQRSIPSGRTMATHEQIELIHKLLSCKESDRTPDGKSIFRILTQQDLDRFFTP